MGPNSRHRDSFIYEYVGDVVNNNSFLKRMRQYAEEGIRHFYFMMLQKDEVSSILELDRNQDLPADNIFTLGSSSMQRRRVESVDSPITVVIQIAMWRNGRWAHEFVWGSLRTGISRRTRN